MTTTFTVQYDQMDADDRTAILAGLTGNDDDALLAAEQAFNQAVFELTGHDPGVQFDLSQALYALKWEA